jgi:hypothetical protein
MNSGSTSTGIPVEGEASPMAVVIMCRPPTLHLLCFDCLKLFVSQCEGFPVSITTDQCILLK